MATATLPRLVVRSVSRPDAVCSLGGSQPATVGKLSCYALCCTQWEKEGEHGICSVYIVNATQSVRCSQERDDEHEVLTRNKCSMLKTKEWRQQWWVSVGKLLFSRLHRQCLMEPMHSSCVNLDTVVVSDSGKLGCWSEDRHSKKR